MSWLIPSIPGWSRTPAASPVKTEDKRVDGEEEEEDLDIPPPFPLLNSHQRSSAPGPSKATGPAPTPSFNLAPPSPPRNTDDDEPVSDLNIAVTDGTVPIGDMAPPPSTTKKPDFGIQKGGDTSTAGSSAGLGATSKPKGKKGKVALAPGCSALDWARLCSSGKDLKGTGFGILRVTMDELKKHNTRQDAWSAFNGKVYNMTAYLPFHPGGEDELMRVAGRDGTKLFMLTHSWVNMDYMLQECMVGVMVRG